MLILKVLALTAVLVSVNAMASVNFSKLEPESTIRLDLLKMGKKFVEIPSKNGDAPLILVHDQPMQYRGAKEMVADGKKFKVVTLAMQSCTHSSTSDEVQIGDLKRPVYVKVSDDCTLTLRQLAKDSK